MGYTAANATGVMYTLKHWKNPGISDLRIHKAVRVGYRPYARRTFRSGGRTSIKLLFAAENCMRHRNLIPLNIVDYPMGNGHHLDAAKLSYRLNHALMRAVERTPHKWAI